MANRRRSSHSEPKTLRPPATTPEGRENQLISLAVNLAEQKLADGTASSQVIVHYLKLGSSRERLEQERLQRENTLLDAKTDAIASGKKVEELYKTALDAMRSYAGLETLESYED
jgi:hypothetical protein